MIEGLSFPFLKESVKVLNANINNVFNSSHLGGPVTRFSWLLLFAVSLYWCSDRTITWSILSTDGSRRAAYAKWISSFAVLDTSALCSVVCKHSGQILAAA